MTLDWFPRVLGSRCGRYTIVATRTLSGAWSYLPFHIEDGVSKPLGSAVDSVEQAQENCNRHSRLSKQPTTRTGSDAAQSSTDSATEVKKAYS